MKSRIKRRKIRHSDALNTRGVSYTYVPVDDVHSVAIPAGRCFRCRKITTTYCFGCDRYICKNHTMTREDELWCPDCHSKNVRRNVHLTYVG